MCVPSSLSLLSLLSLSLSLLSCSACSRIQYRVWRYFIDSFFLHSPTTTTKKESSSGFVFEEGKRVSVRKRNFVKTFSPFSLSLCLSLSLLVVVVFFFLMMVCVRERKLSISYIYISYKKVNRFFIFLDSKIQIQHPG